MKARHVVRAASRVALATLGLLLALATGTALAATFTVNSTTDAVDAGGCTPAQCTLRDAVLAANAAGGTSTITLPAGTYDLTIAPSGNDDASTGDLNVTSAITINGAGSASTTIDGGGASSTVTDRVFRVESTGSLTLSGATIQHGHPAGGQGMLSEGGGILALGALTLTDATVSNNFVDAPGLNGGGAGIALEAPVPLSLTRVTVSTNTVNSSTGAIAGGGGLLLSGGPAAIDHSTIGINTAAGPGGGVYSTSGSLTITDTTISENQAVLPANAPAGNQASGGGLATGGSVPVDLDRDVIASNNAAQSGGGISDQGGSAYTITDTMITFNGAVAGFTGGVSSIGGGGIAAGGGSTNPGWQLSGDLIAFNGAGDGGHPNVPGGGIDEDHGDKFTVVNTTMFGNTATGSGGAYESRSGGTHNLTNVTIDSNSAGSGGSIDIQNHGTFTLGNTIISRGTPGNCHFVNGGTLVSHGHNLETADTCSLRANGDLTNTDPKLGTLNNNGGPTLTEALGSGSPAIDAGDNALCPATDQRGASRSENATCDIGAYELLHSITVTNADDSGSGSLRDAITRSGAETTIGFSPALNGQTIRLTSGALVIPHGLTISGPGASQLTIDGNHQDSVINVDAPAQTDDVTISGLTLTGGASSDPSGGGAIFADAVNTLTLNGDTITGNSATVSAGNLGGGGVLTDARTLTTVTNSTITNNSVTITGAINSAHGGGGIYNDGEALVVSGSVVSGNTVTQTSTSNSGFDGGGGIFDNGIGLTLTNSSVENNSVTVDMTHGFDGGAGVYENGDALTITGSRINGNTFQVSNSTGGFNGGAGVYNDGEDVTVTSSSIDGNSATVGGSGSGVNGGIGLYHDGSNLAVVSSTIANNTGTVTSSSGSNGGGAVYDDGSNSTYLNSTLSGNSLTVTSPGQNNGGGAIHGNGAPGSISASTIAGNTINQPGGAIFNEGDPYALKTSILAGNSQGNCGGSGTFTSAGSNLESADTCGFHATGDLTNTDPKLGPLGDNGGPTPTQALPANSPAVDAGSCTDVAGAPVSTDQRGVARPQPAGGKCDIGAFELVAATKQNPPPPPPPQSAPGAQTSPPSSTVSTGATLAGAVNPNGQATTYFFQYGLDPALRPPGASTALYDQSTASQSLPADSNPHAVSAAVGGLVPNALYHVRLVAVNATGTSFGPDQTFKTPTGPPAPPPVLGQSQNAKPVSGHVFALIGGQLVPLTQTQHLPSGTVLDARAGSLELISAAAHGHKPQTGVFGGAIFKVTEARSGLTTLSLVEGVVRGAPTYASCAAHGAGDQTAQAALSRRILQTLRSRASGSFRTRGRYASGTVRGTQWTTTDRCDGTVIAVQLHTVLVTDLVKHITVPVHAGHSYLAKAPKHR